MQREQRAEGAHRSPVRGLLLSFICIFMVIVSVELVRAQHVPGTERGDPTFRRKTNIDGNNVRTTIFNFGFTGRTGVVPDEVPYEWPKNTRQMYIALTALFVGGEVLDENGEVRHIVSIPNYRESPAGDSWTFEPVPGYFKLHESEKEDKIAKSDEPDSWPDFWPDKLDDAVDPGWRGTWNGFFGKNQFNADQEMYFRTSDDLYARHNYFPDTTDLTRKGLGLQVDYRVLEWSQILINDVVFILHFIKNDGTKDIDKAAVTLWLADLVGGDGDSQDDKPFFDLINDVAWSTDSDGRGNAAFGNDPVGVAATSYIETPGNAFNGIDDDGDGEENSPFVSLDMLVGEDPSDGVDNNGNGLVDENQTHVPFGAQRGVGFRDYIDNDGDAESGSPVVTPDMLAGEIAGNAIDDNGNGIIDEDDSDIGSAYADGIDNDGDGLIDDGIDEMIDESREDGIDNDGDWSVLFDDVGLDGAPGTGDPGEGDGVPTSGAGTDFPGEPNIDKTDISESDQIGLTNVQYDAAGAYNFNVTSDELLWSRFMVPGSFYNPNIPLQTPDNDLFVSSGLFPLKAGLTERIAIAVNLGQDQADALRNKDNAQKAYEADYRFAKAPLTPTVTAVPGDRRVTLYWDDVAEESFDSFLASLGEVAEDFEGYRVYRATDPAFLDALKVTDADGNLVFYKPIAQFDLEDGLTGLHPISVNGAQFNLGDDTGLLHTFVDTTVQNGQTYFYAVTAYDFGFEAGEVGPTETPIVINVDAEGNVEAGKNVAVVTPNPPAAGYVPADIEAIELISGSTTGKLFYEIIDPRTIIGDARYRITFEDTLIAGQRGASDTLRTKNFTLARVHSVGDVDTLIDRSTQLGLDDELPLIDGFILSFENETSIGLNEELSHWNREGAYGFSVRQFRQGFTIGTQRPSDYEITFGEVGIDSSTAFLFFGATAVNFQVRNISENRQIEFAFQELDGSGGELTVNASESDRVIFLEPDVTGALTPTWDFRLVFDSVSTAPAAADLATVILRKPFLSEDVFEFTTRAEGIDIEKAKNSLDRIKVVPNPYVVAATWEPQNPFISGRGPQAIHFNHLPALCTIRIYSISGELVATIEHESSIDDGTADWDLLSRDNLAISYGIYIYHVDAPGIGEKVGKFAIIK